jgi:hypothetical protein
MYFQWSPWSHVGTFVRDGYVVDATTAGVIKHPFSDYLDGESYVMVGSPPASDQQRTAMLEHVESRIGTPYGWLTLIRLGIETLIGHHHRFHRRLFWDVLLTLMMLSLPALKFPRVLRVTSGIAAGYTIVVLINLRSRRQMRRRIEQNRQPRFEKCH